ncbi:MAG: HAMP domain-containing protein [Desulfobacterales bacterium]|nr:HAMP domain-containing histidine kinase [Deltaproteobacteria bacterium]NNK93668.1 HAMP domain-containing protein [Desulfobacterales bacterium]
MSIQSIGSKLTFWYTGLLTLTFLLAGSITYGLLVYSLSRDMDYALNSIGSIMADKIRSEGNSFYPSEVDDLFRRFFGFSPLERHFDILDPRRRFEPEQPDSLSADFPISPQELERATRGESHFETMMIDETVPVRVLTMPVIDSGRLVNLIRVGMSLENMYKTRHRFLLIMAAVFPLGLILAGGGGWLLARRALRPVDRMTQTAKKISGEHLSQRLQESGNRDELDRLARTLNDMLDRLHGAIDQMRRFSADASHELQTPLTILKGEMEVALLKPRSPEEYQEVLTSGLEEIDRINHLVEGLLLLARADSGMLRFDLQLIDLNELLEKTLLQLTPLATNRSLRFKFKPIDPFSVKGDGEHLRRVFLNLLTNAIKHSHCDEVIEVTLLQEEKWAVIQIADSGTGIPTNEQKLIFNRFHRLSESRSAAGKEGVGLGLSIALSIVAAHGGTINVESSPGVGSTFSVHLPAILP